ncbi:MAG: aminoglycoside phosphotransferase family protein, partial [Mucilaginibacter polytrichastri]|nr:aminoglycoside phosphotransferase family protein [Mucilaginibacter polytrichastri]
FISDVGDMMRTYLSPVNEESTEFSAIAIEDEYLQAITDGYLSEMQAELSEPELAAFYFSGSFMIYMQALRFLTDYLNNDAYYGAKYPDHNLNRAKNQLTLLKRYDEKIVAKSVPAL